MKTIIVTGGAGFIGSAVVRALINEKVFNVVNVDKLTYAANLKNLKNVMHSNRYSFVKMDICDLNKIKDLLENYKPDAIIHLAAESHVDRSIDGPREFINTNIIGTYNLLNAALNYFKTISDNRRKGFRFLHVSTDEVYGSLGESGKFLETTAYKPNSPYAASKAASDLLVRSWYKTYGMPVIISNCSNNYGYYQFPEKLIPLMIIKAYKGEPLPIYGKGENVRDWIHVDDHVDALLLILNKGKLGETYNIGGNCELSNYDVVQYICDEFDELFPNSINVPHRNLITYVPDRPGHDFRYAIDSTKIQNELGWKAKESIKSGIKRTIKWYIDNKIWWEDILEKKYKCQRLGKI